MFISLINLTFNFFFKEGIFLYNTTLLFIFSIIIPFNLNITFIQFIEIHYFILWLSLFIIILFSLEYFYQKDHEDGSIELYLYSSINIELYIFYKTFIQWFLHIFSIFFILPIWYIFLNKINYNFLLIIHIFIFLLILLNIGFICTSLTLGIKYKNIIIPLISIPLYSPIFIFNNEIFFIQNLFLIFIFSIFLYILNIWITSKILFYTDNYT